MMPKFTVPKSLLSLASSPAIKQLSAAAKELSERPETTSSLIASHPSIKTNKLLSEQLELFKKSATDSDATARKALRLAAWANIIAIIAIAIAIKDQLFEVIVSWFS
jgi:hypothetical protein